MLPKIKKTLPLTYPPVGYERREQLLEDINKDGTYLPKSLLHEDFDRGFMDFVKHDLKTVVSGNLVKVVDILMTTQNWSQFTQTWDFNNIDKNAQPPFITIVRTPEVKYGIYQIDDSIITLRYQRGMDREKVWIFIQYLNLTLLI